MPVFKNLLAYKKAYDLAMQIFRISKKFPPDEKYSLTDQIRRSSRSVCANLAEACRRNVSTQFFISKLNDSHSENSETLVWIDFSRDCEYIDDDIHADLSNLNIEVDKLIYFMIKNPTMFM